MTARRAGLELFSESNPSARPPLTYPVDVSPEVFAPNDIYINI